MITVLASTGSLAAGATIELDDSEAHHLRVRRPAPNERIRIVDGAGAVAVGEVGPNGRTMRVAIHAVEMAPPPPPLVLAVAAGDRDRFAIMVEKAAELGVTEVVPLDTARSESVATRVREQHVERLERRALEALKQCGSAWAPKIVSPRALAEFLAEPRPGPRWVADRHGAAPPAPAAGPLTIMVGPEGGFTADERDHVLRSGYLPVALGPHVLRFETAAIAGAALAWQLRPRSPVAGG